MKKIQNFIPAQLCAMACISFSLLTGCASPEERGAKQIDTITNSPQDTVGTDTVTNTGSMSGSNGTGTDTTDTKRQKATRQKAND